MKKNVAIFLYLFVLHIFFENLVYGQGTFATFFVDGIGYSLNSDSTGAIVEAELYMDVNHNYRNISKKVVIPKLIEHKGNTYPVINIAGYAFYYSYIDSIFLPNSVISIGEWAFSHTGLKYVEFGNSIERISEKAFSGTAIKELRLPASLQYIGSNTFENLGALKDIYCAATTPPNLGYYPFFRYGDMEALLAEINLHVPLGTGSLYKNAGHWGYFNIIEDVHITTSSDLLEGKKGVHKIYESGHIVICVDKQKYNLTGQKINTYNTEQQPNSH